METALKKQLTISVDIVTGNIDVNNDDSLTNIEILGLLEYAKVCYFRSFMTDDETL